MFYEHRTSMSHPYRRRVCGVSFVLQIFGCNFSLVFIALLAMLYEKTDQMKISTDNNGSRAKNISGLMENRIFRKNARRWFLAHALFDSIRDMDIRSAKYLLIVKKANPNLLLKKYGVTSLHIAAGLEDERIGLEMLRLCIVSHGDPNVRCSEGLTPVHIAAYWNRITLLNFLVECGGNLKLRDDDGCTPLHYLRMNEMNKTNQTLLLTSLQKNNSDSSSEVPRSSHSRLPNVESDDDLLESSNYVESDSTLLNSPSFDATNDLMNEAFLVDDVSTEYDSFRMCEEDFYSDVESELNFIEIFNSYCHPCKISGEKAFVNSSHSVFSNLCLKKSALCSLNDSRPSCELVPLKSLYNVDSSWPPSSSTRCSLESAGHIECMKDSDNISSGSCSSCSTEVLKQRLRENGIFCGPVVKSTKRVYLYQLKKLKQGFPSLGIKPQEHLEFNDVVITTFNGKLRECISKWSQLEDEMMMIFNSIDSLETKLDYSKHYFNYLLLDPRITGSIKKTCGDADLGVSWPYFLKSIFYVGKGKNARPMDHLMVALKSKAPSTEKIRRIQQIWSEGLGIVCLHIFHNISEPEALTREACMISTLSIAKLTNVQSGRYYGSVRTWSLKSKRQLGVTLLFRALMLLIAEGERQIFPLDLGK